MGGAEPSDSASRELSCTDRESPTAAGRALELAQLIPTPPLPFAAPRGDPLSVALTRRLAVLEGPPFAAMAATKSVAAATAHSIADTGAAAGRDSAEKHQRE